MPELAKQRGGGGRRLTTWPGRGALGDGGLNELQLLLDEADGASDLGFLPSVGSTANQIRDAGRPGQAQQRRQLSQGGGGVTLREQGRDEPSRMATAAPSQLPRRDLIYVAHGLQQCGHFQAISAAFSTRTPPLWLQLLPNPLGKLLRTQDPTVDRVGEGRNDVLLDSLFNEGPITIARHKAAE